MIVTKNFDLPRAKAPGDPVWYKAVTNVLLTRSFVDFVLHDPLAIELYEWYLVIDR